MGGKSSPTNNQMVQFELEQAAKARDKETQRQARLTQGKQMIDQLFGAGSFNQPFYDKYKSAELAYNMPQLQLQYDKAKRDMTYDLARAGTLRSTAAGQAQGLLENEKAVNEAGIRAKADTDTAALRNSILSQQNQAYNQLYSTEDPDVAANTATQSVANAQLSKPNLDPLGDMFKPLIIGATGAFGGYNDQQRFQDALRAPNPYRSSSTTTQTY